MVDTESGLAGARSPVWRKTAEGGRRVSLSGGSAHAHGALILQGAAGALCLCQSRVSMTGGSQDVDEACTVDFQTTGAPTAPLRKGEGMGTPRRLVSGR